MLNASYFALISPLCVYIFLFIKSLPKICLNLNIAVSPTESDLLTEKIIGAAIEVHRHLGPGLLESAYEVCLAYELQLRNLKVERQQQLPIIYKGVKLDCDYRIDLLVEDEIIIEVKSVKELIPVHEAQLLSYLRLRGGRKGLLINFNVPLLKEGIRRLKI